MLNTDRARSNYTYYTRVENERQAMHHRRVENERQAMHHLQCSHTGFEKPHETALELVYRAENRCKSIGARAGGLFQALLGPIWARKGPTT